MSMRILFIHVSSYIHHTFIVTLILTHSYTLYTMPHILGKVIDFGAVSVSAYPNEEYLELKAFLYGLNAAQEHGM